MSQSSGDHVEVMVRRIRDWAGGAGWGGRRRGGGLNDAEAEWVEWWGVVVGWGGGRAVRHSRGYRLVDTAENYRNEVGVGRACAESPGTWCS